MVDTRSLALADALRLIHDTSLLPVAEVTGGWGLALNRVADFTEAALAALFLRDARQAITDLEVVGLHGYPDASIAAYRSYFAPLDGEAVQVSRLAVGQHLVVTPEQMAANPVSAEIQNEYFRPIGGGQGVGFKLFDDRDRFCMISLHRHVDARRIDDDDVATLRIVVAHIRRALRVQRQLAGVERLNGSLLAALDYLPNAVFVIDRHAAPVSMNRAADALLRNPDGPLRIKHGRLVTALAADTSPLASAIATLVGCVGVPDLPPPLLRVSGRTGTAYGVMLGPVPASDATWANETLALLFVSAGGQVAAPVAAILKQEFGLTDAEAAVAAGLGQGLAGDEIAARRGVSQETVRSQIKSLLSKTDTRSQARLVARLLRSLGGLAAPPR